MAEKTDALTYEEIYRQLDDLEDVFGPDDSPDRYEGAP